MLITGEKSEKNFPDIPPFTGKNVSYGWEEGEEKGGRQEEGLSEGLKQLIKWEKSKLFRSLTHFFPFFKDQQQLINGKKVSNKGKKVRIYPVRLTFFPSFPKQRMETWEKSEQITLSLTFFPFIK